MYYAPNMYPQPYPYYGDGPIYNYGSQPVYGTPYGLDYGTGMGPFYPANNEERVTLKDYGPNPYVVNINQASKQNRNYRTTLWTGTHLQLTLMSLNPGEDIGLEMHPNVDQFLRIEQGQGRVEMGTSQSNLTFKRKVSDDSAIFVPAGTWHNVINTGKMPLKLYSIYAPPNHPFGTVHTTKAQAMAAEASHRYGNGIPFGYYTR